MENKILMEIVNYPIDIRINGEEYCTVCEFIDKNGKEMSVLEKADSNDVIVVSKDGFAIVGLFSSAENKIKELADFIEATIMKKHVFEFSEVEFVKSILTVTDRKEYPFLHYAVDQDGGKPTFYQNMVMNFRERSGKRALPLEFLKQLKIHTVLVEEIKPVEEELFKTRNSEESYEKSKPIITQAKALPEGWKWHDFDDGSGCLKSPEDKSMYSYDLAPYSGQGAIEYKRDKESGWDIYTGTLRDFKDYAESSIKKDLELVLGDIYLPKIMAEIERNAWNGKEPRKVCVSSGEHVIEIEGYTYEQSYEYFTADVSIMFDGIVLYERDARCVGPYQYETYHKGSFETHADAIRYIKEQTKELEYSILPAEKESLENKIQEAGEKASAVQEKIQQRDNKTEPEMSF